MVSQLGKQVSLGVDRLVDGGQILLPGHEHTVRLGLLSKPDDVALEDKKEKNQTKN